MHSSRVILAIVFLAAGGAKALAGNPPLPADYRDYALLEKTLSPNGRYAFLYPRADRLDQVKTPRLCLIALDPFRVLKDVPVKDSTLIRGHGWYEVIWSKGSSSVVIMEGNRTGIGGVFALMLRDGKASKPVDLAAEIRRQALSDFQKARVPPLNDEEPFAIWRDANQSWGIDDFGHVTIDCFCSNDPKSSRHQEWTARFRGVWDLPSSHFIRVNLKSSVRHE